MCRLYLACMQGSNKPELSIIRTCDTFPAQPGSCNGQQEHQAGGAVEEVWGPLGECVRVSLFAFFMIAWWARWLIGKFDPGNENWHRRSRASPHILFYDNARGYVTLLGGLHHLFHSLFCKVIVYSGLLSSLAFILYMPTVLPTMSTLFFNQVRYRVIHILIVCCSNGMVTMNIYLLYSLILALPKSCIHRWFQGQPQLQFYSTTALYGQSKRLDMRSSQHGLPKTTNNWPHAYWSSMIHHGNRSCKVFQCILWGDFNQERWSVILCKYSGSM